MRMDMCFCLDGVFNLNEMLKNKRLRNSCGAQFASSNLRLPIRTTDLEKARHGWIAQHV